MSHSNLSPLPPALHQVVLHLVETLLHAYDAAPGWCPGCQTLRAAEAVVTAAQTETPTPARVDGTATEARVVALLADRRPPGLTAGRVAKHLGLPVGTVVPVLDTLALRGVVQRNAKGYYRFTCTPGGASPRA